ncbi:MAG: hypothetical protein N3A38_04295 [Planctomycetota bacterium]|nr:hypothetical protein [Planctomycetota bacterium]
MRIARFSSYCGFLAFACGAAAPAAEVGPEVVLPASPRPAHTPAVACGGGKYLVVWESGRAEHADIYACRLDETGRLLDSSPILVCGAKECQDRPRAAWGKDCWLVVWEDVRNDRDFDVYAARVTPEGKVLDPDGILVAGGGNNQCSPDVAFNGESFLVAWRSWENNKYMAAGARVSPGGKVLDARPLPLSAGLPQNSGAGELKVASAGGSWMVGWASRSYAPPGAPGGPGGLFLSVVDGAGKAALSHAIRNQGMDNVKSPVTVASDGKGGYLFSWYNGTTGGRSGTDHGMPYGAALFDTSGKLTATTVLGAPKAYVRMPAAAFDGKGYLIAHWLGHRRDPNRGFQEDTNKIVAFLIAADGKYEGQIEVSSGKPNPSYAPAVAGDGKGNALIVYERHPADADPLETPILIAARLLRR